MLLLPTARKRIGSLAFCVRRGWFTSCALPRSLSMTITIRRFPQFSIQFGSQDRKFIARYQRRREKPESLVRRKGGPKQVGTPFLCVPSMIDSLEVQVLFTTGWR